MKLCANFKVTAPEAINWMLFTRHGNAFNLCLVTLDRQTKEKTVAVARTNRKAWETALSEASANPSLTAVPVEFHTEQWLQLVRSALPRCVNAMA